MLDVWIVATGQGGISQLGSYSLARVTAAVWLTAAVPELTIAIAGVPTDVMAWLNGESNEGPLLVSGSKVTLDLFCSYLG